jgi:hypothetical protein
MLRIFIALENPRHLPGFETANLDFSGKHDNQYNAESDWVRVRSVSFMHYTPRHPNGQLHTPAALPPGEVCAVLDG